MELEEKLEVLLGFQLLALAVVSAGIILLNPDRASKLYLFEFLGVLLASIITVFGIREMRDLTS